MSHTEILAEHPDLEPDDIKAALAFASHRVDHPHHCGMKIWLDERLSPQLARSLPKRRARTPAVP
jgi:hypothetical protein